MGSLSNFAIHTTKCQQEKKKTKPNLQTANLPRELDDIETAAGREAERVACVRREHSHARVYNYVTKAGGCNGCKLPRLLCTTPRWWKTRRRNSRQIEIEQLSRALITGHLKICCRIVRGRLGEKRAELGMLRVLLRRVDGYIDWLSSFMRSGTCDYLHAIVIASY